MPLKQFIVMVKKIRNARPYENQTRMDGVGATLVVAQPNAEDEHDPALGEIIGAWKSIVTDEYIRGMRDLDWEPFYRKLWQRNYGACPERSEGSTLFAMKKIEPIANWVWRDI